MSWRSVVHYLLGVLGVTVTAVALLAMLGLAGLVFCSSDGKAQQPPLVLWQLGQCVHEPGDRPACISLGKPVPEGVCMAMRRALIREGAIGRVVCARVLVDDA
jgi:hypothetical protein